jgi:CBS domain-containing protein
MATLRTQHEEGERVLGALRAVTSRHRADPEAWHLLALYLDLVRGHITSEDEALFPIAERVEWTAVRTAMTAAPVAVTPDTPAVDVARLLVARGFNAVPVSERGELVGVISRGDILRGLVAASVGS